MTFFGKELPIQKSLKINHEVIDTCNKILDLLLIYGIEPKLKWTDAFSGNIKSIRESIIPFTDNIVSLKSIISDMDKKYEQNEVRGIKKHLLIGVGSVISYSLLRFRHPILFELNSNQLRDVIYSIDHIQSEVTSVSTDIKKDYKKLIHDRRRDLIYTFNLWAEKSKKNDLDNKYARTFPLELLTHILQFENDFTKEVVGVRAKQKRIINFWKQEKDDIVVTEATLPSNRI